jgi:RNA polymerase-binding transcription factor DksA
MAALTKQQIQKLAKLLDNHYTELGRELENEVNRSKEENYVDLVPSSPDSGESSVANLISDLDDIIVDKHTKEIEEIIAAKQRIADSRYGICIDCKADIGYDRLLAQPAAKRCIECQRRYEKKQADTISSL